MGMVLTYQAIPAGSGLVELVQRLARDGGDQSSAVQFVPVWLERGLLVQPGSELEGDIVGPQDRAIWRWCRNAVQRYPGIEKRQFDAGKAIDWWKFALSASYRTLFRSTTRHPPDESQWDAPAGSFDDMVRMAFLGAPVIAPATFATQGFPIQYSAARRRRVRLDAGHDQREGSWQPPP